MLLGGGGPQAVGIVHIGFAFMVNVIWPIAPFLVEELRGKHDDNGFYLGLLASSYYWVTPPAYPVPRVSDPSRRCLPPATTWPTRRRFPLRGQQAQALAAPFWGLAIDRLGTRRCLLFGLVAIGSTTAGFGAARQRSPLQPPAPPRRASLSGAA